MYVAPHSITFSAFQFWITDEQFNALWIKVSSHSHDSWEQVELLMSCLVFSDIYSLLLLLMDHWKVPAQLFSHSLTMGLTPLIRVPEMYREIVVF